jgi:hypothetical protein
LDNVLVVVDKDMASWHYALSPAGLVPHCSVKCTFAVGMDRLAEAAGAIFLGDKELYSRTAQDLPARPNKDIVYFAILREYLALFPEQLWTRYDARITYSRQAHTAVPYSCVSFRSLCLCSS